MKRPIILGLILLCLFDLTNNQEDKDIYNCQIISDPSEENCNSLNEHLSTYRELIRKEWACCYESWKVDMTEYHACRHVKFEKKAIGDEKKRVKDYYKGHDFKILCATSFLKINLPFLFAFIIFVLA